MSRNKYDKRLVAGKAPDEVETVQKRMKKEGIEISATEIRELVKEYGHSRRRIYAIIRERHAQSNPAA